MNVVAVVTVYVLTILVGTGVRGRDYGMTRRWPIRNGPGRHVNVVASLARPVDARHAMTIICV
jgi:hypothetical protein